MPFIPHTKKDVEQMLTDIGVADIETLFDEIPQSLKQFDLNGVPEGVSEMTLSQQMQQRAKQDEGMLSFLGAGAYEHHIPAAVWDLAARGEFYTAYTPYQAEASQGSLQLIYEYQSMMASLMALDVSNASLYDGATALAEAVLMAVRLSRKKGQAKIIVPKNLHPYYRETLQTILQQQNIAIVEVAYDDQTGKTKLAELSDLSLDEVVGLVIPQPNFFGILEDVDQLTDWAAEHKLISIAVVNPLAMALLKPPGQWGQDGVDIACGEGQPLGIPLASGGPYYGFMCCKKKHVRQLPGRIVGKTVDTKGREGFVLTLQAREQHIRRAKATSNICTNQGLMVTASTIYMSLLGPQGLYQVAAASHQNTRAFAQAIEQIDGVSVQFESPYFHELVLKFEQPIESVMNVLAEKGILGGFALSEMDSRFANSLLVCLTECKTEHDIASYVTALEEACKMRSVVGGNVG